MATNHLATLLKGLADANYDKSSARFIVKEAHYTSANGTDQIRLHILVPKTLTSKQPQGPRPVIVRIHGGYLITGSSLYAPWLSNWVLELAIGNDAIIVSPNYRLMPEANGTEILADVDACWNWLRENGAKQALEEIAPGLQLDLKRVMVLGESAGGYLAVQLGLSYPKEIAALLAVYPLLDPEDDFYNTEYDKPICGVPNLPVSILDDHLQTLREGSRSKPAVATESDPPERLALSFTTIQNGRYLDLLGRDNEKLYPLRRIAHHADADATDSGANLPPMFICHGRDDSAVPVDGTVAFVEALKHHRPQAKCHLEIQPGDHGMDFDASVDHTDWLKRGLDFVTPYWLGELSPSG